VFCSEKLKKSRLSTRRIKFIEEERMKKSFVFFSSLLSVVVLEVVLLSACPCQGGHRKGVNFENQLGRLVVLDGGCGCDGGGSSIDPDEIPSDSV